MVSHEKKELPFGALARAIFSAIFGLYFCLFFLWTLFPFGIIPLLLFGISWMVGLGSTDTCLLVFLTEFGDLRIERRVL